MKCFYHNDMDGRCAASLVAQYTHNFESVNYYEVDYRTPLPIDNVEVGETVYIVDYSFTKHTVDTLCKLIDNGCAVIWIDHHTSSIELMNDPAYKWLNDIDGIRSSDFCGAALVYHYFNDTTEFSELPRYIQLVDDYDRWVFNLGDYTNYFKLGLETFPYDALDSVWNDLFNYDRLIFDSIIERGKAIKMYIDENNAENLANYGYESEILGLKCYVINRRSNSWIFGDKINEYPCVVTWVFDGSQYTYSIYSIDPDVDCSKIAEYYGGGGHKGAAGFHADNLLLQRC